MIKKLTIKEVEKFYQTDAYVVLGAGGDLSEWEEGYTQMFEEAGIGTPTIFKTTGKTMNQAFGITADPFWDKLTVLIIPLEGLDLSKLAILRLKLQDRWMRDLIDNTLAREPDAA